MNVLYLLDFTACELFRAQVLGAKGVGPGLIKTAAFDEARRSWQCGSSISTYLYCSVVESSALPGGGGVGS